MKTVISSLDKSTQRPTLCGIFSLINNKELNKFTLVYPEIKFIFLTTDFKDLF